MGGDGDNSGISVGIVIGVGDAEIGIGVECAGEMGIGAGLVEISDTARGRVGGMDVVAVALAVPELITFFGDGVVVDVFSRDGDDNGKSADDDRVRVRGSIKSSSFVDVASERKRVSIIERDA